MILFVAGGRECSDLTDLPGGLRRSAS